MPFDAAVVVKLQEWGLRHEFTKWEGTPRVMVQGEECSIWKTCTRYGTLTIRFSSILARRELGTQLIQELDLHQVGRLAQKGNWHVHALANGQDVRVTFREDISLENLVESEGSRSWQG